MRIIAGIFVSSLLFMASIAIADNSVQRIVNIETTTPTLDTSAYASGDRLGSVQTIVTGCRSLTSATLRSVVILDKGAQSKEVDLYIFSALPTIASADNAAIDFTDAMLLLVAGYVNVPATAFKASASNSFASVLDINLDLLVDTTGKFYVVPVVRATVTYSASDLVFSYAVECNAGAGV